MRIVGGTYRGRAIKAPKGILTRPTTDRVREALFSALASRMGNDLGGASVLDAFGGSGALGLEALSRGASRATFVENDRNSLRVLKANIATLGADKVAKIAPSDVFALAKKGILGGPFALILLDPPYTLDPANVLALLEQLALVGEIAPGAFITYEHAAGVEPEWRGDFVLDSRKHYGGTEIDIVTFGGDVSR